MTRTFLAIASLLLASEASALSRYSAAAMTCAELQSAVRGEGAAIIRFVSPRSGLPLSDRYVRDRQFCSSEQVAEPISIPSSDRDACPVQHCVDFEFVPESH